MQLYTVRPFQLTRIFLRENKGTDAGSKLQIACCLELSRSGAMSSSGVTDGGAAKDVDAPAGLTRNWLELWPAEPWLLVSISALASKCAWAAARTLASQAMGEDCPELSLPLHHCTSLRWPILRTRLSLHFLL